MFAINSSKTMNTIFMLLVTIVLQVASGSPITYKECILESTPVLRTFHSLIEYQSNKISFDANHSDFSGNFVSFDFDSIDKLVKNAFITYDSGNLIGMDLANKRIQHIEDGAFTTLFCLHYLDLSQNNITYIHQETFGGIEHVRKINISHNNIKVLPDFVFQKLTSLEILDVSSNRVKVTDSLALSNLENLKELYLGNNNLKYIPKIFFWDLRNTRLLDLHTNDFESVLFNVFRNMDALEIVDLSSNKISEVEFFETHSDSMQRLDLSDNLLNNLDVKGLKENLPTLNELDLNENRFRCTDLKFLIENLKACDINITKGRSNDSKHQIYNIFCENIIKPTVTTAKAPEEPTNVTSFEMWQPPETQELGHSSNNFLILILFCVILGLGVLFVLDYFFASGSVFGACNRAASRSFERSAAQPEGYMSLNGR